MSRQIIKQPNGKYCIFSSIVDSITEYNLTEEEIIEMWAEEAKIQIAATVKTDIAALNAGAKPYYQFTKTFADALATIKMCHGAKAVRDARRLVGQ